MAVTDFIPGFDAGKAVFVIVAAAACVAVCFGAGWQLQGMRKDLVISEKTTKITELTGSISTQNVAIESLGREAKNAQAKASEAAVEAAKLRKVANNRAGNIMAVKSTDCGATVKQVWGMVQ